VIRIQLRIQRGEYPVDLVEELDRRELAWWQVDGRVRRLDSLLRAFREQEYLPLEDGLWVAGKRLARDAGGGADFELRIAGPYFWAGPEGALRVDGRPAANPAELADGPHRAEWSGAGPLLLVRAPPEHWPAAWRRAGGPRATSLSGGR
jgi:hypothetical protein